MIALTKKTLLFLTLMLIGIPCFVSADKLPNKYSELKELRDRLQTKEDIVERQWKSVVKNVNDESVSKERKLEVLEKFIKDFPENNKHLRDAELMLSELKDSSLNPEHVLNRNSYRTKTEWFSLNFAGGNFGFGGGFTFVTLRWENIFWEVFRVQATGDYLIGNKNARVAANAKTMVGMPFFLDKTNRHEIRISSGFSGGFTAKYLKKWDWDTDFDYMSFINVPVDVSYVFHIKRNFSFQLGLAVDLPVLFYDRYVPSVNGYIGFRI